MSHKAWLICKDTLNCDKWGETPEDFNESKHFGRCGACNGPACLVHSDPRWAGYTKANKIEMQIVSQNGAGVLESR